ncbi:MAG: cytidine deaminase [Candidatus Fermentibacteraceae bacterium]
MSGESAVRDRLLQTARGLVDRCRCPYSRFRVTAAVMCSDGSVHGGVNVENASYGLTMCAERAAMFAAVSAGCGTITDLLVYSPDGDPTPCGACLQVAAELGPPSMRVHMADPDGRLETVTLSSLLPRSFGLDT